MLAAQDAELFGHYWVSRAALTNYVDATQPPHDFRPDAFFALVGDFAQVGMRHLEVAPPHAVEVSVLFGGHDPVVKRQESLQALSRIFMNLEHETFDDAGHWPHGERPEPSWTGCAQGRLREG